MLVRESVSNLQNGVFFTNTTTIIIIERKKKRKKRGGKNKTRFLN